MIQSLQQLAAEPDVQKLLSQIPRDGARKPRGHSVEAKQRMSEAAKRRYADPEQRRLASERSRRMWSDPAIRKSIRESLRKSWTPHRRAEFSAIYRAGRAALASLS